jgi:hypothetical protein|nr:PIN domain-containing protein [uncultured Acetatifactor sp.]
MFHFMIDLENTRSKGLQGAEYLSPDDHVTVFYSESCLKVEKGKLQQIIDAGSVLDICRLQRNGKNALDFYITSKVGELFGAGYQGIVAIVSGDKGYCAVQDYWAKCVKPARTVILQPNIEQCIGCSNESSPRRGMIQERLREVNLETQFGMYGEHLKMRQILEDSFADTAYRDLLGQIVSVVERQKGCGRRVLYLDTIKRFGRKKGLEIYTKIKQTV